jgi:hypothetical protein
MKDTNSFSSSTYSGFRASEFPDSVLVAEPDMSGVLQGDAASVRLSSALSVDVIVYVAITSLVLGAFQISRMRLFESGDNTGYWLGVAGASMMLLLFTYPLRKHFRFARNWGKVKWWFVVHMLLGVGGPVLILLHSNFRVGSLNAAVALYSMLAVAASGVVGRFIYARVNRGLHGEQLTLKNLRTRAGIDQDDARSRLAFASKVEAILQEFEEKELNSPPNWWTYTRQVFWLPVQEWVAYERCAIELKRTLTKMAKNHRWKAKDLARRKAHSKTLVRQYLNAVTRVAQYTAYERMFSLWHLAHIPFVYLLILSAIVHVIAVHVY